MSHDQTTAINSLIATTIDSANGFEEAAAQARDMGLANRLAEFARDRWELVERLEDEVRRLGEAPERSGTAKAAVHRRWLDLKNRLMGSDAAILEEIETGETYLRAKFEAAAADETVSSAFGPILADGLSSIDRTQTAARTLKSTVRDARSDHASFDWRRIGTGLGLAVALGGAAYAASRIAARRREPTGVRIPQHPYSGPTVGTVPESGPRPTVTERGHAGTGSAAATAGASAYRAGTDDPIGLAAPGAGAGFGSGTTGTFGDDGTDDFGRK